MMSKGLYSFRRAACVSLVWFLAQVSALPGATRVADERLRMSPATSVAQSVEQPNIIFILTDDQGYGDIQRHGHPYLKTPHLNRLHDESVRMDNFYVSPSCSPTRAALMTGMHEFRSGVTNTLIPREHLHEVAKAVKTKAPSAQESAMFNRIDFV